MISRRSFLVVAGGAVFGARTRGATAWGAERMVVEDWSESALRSRGIPSGWDSYETPGGHPAYDLTVVEDGRRRALRLRSAGDHSTIAKRVQVDLKRTPILEWSWRVFKLPARGDVRRRETSDLTAHILVVWPRFPALLRSRLIGYAWDTMAPAGSVVRSRKTGTVTFVIVRSSSADLGRWLTDRRNVFEDYRTIYGEEPQDPSAIAISIDTNDTRSSAEAFVGPLLFAS
jgi:hypothetical protein